MCLKIDPPIVTTDIIYDLHNVINLSVDVSHVLVLSYYLVNNKICLKQNGQDWAVACWCGWWMADQVTQNMQNERL